MFSDAGHIKRICRGSGELYAADLEFFPSIEGDGRNMLLKIFGAENLRRENTVYNMWLYIPEYGSARLSAYGVGHDKKTEELQLYFLPFKPFAREGKELRKTFSGAGTVQVVFNNDIQTDFIFYPSYDMPHVQR